MRCESCPLAGVVTRLWASFVALSTPMWIFSPEVELVAFLRRMHFRVPLLLFVLRRRRGVDDGGVDDGTLGELQSSGFKMGVDLPEDPLTKVMGLEKVAELADRPFVRYSPRCRGLSQQINPWIPYRRELLRLRGR